LKEFKEVLVIRNSKRTSQDLQTINLPVKKKKKEERKNPKNPLMYFFLKAPLNSMCQVENLFISPLKNSIIMEI